MALQLDSFPNPYDRNNPVADAYVYTAELTINVPNDSVSVVMHVHPNEAAWQDAPVGFVTLTGGEQYPDGGHFPQPSELMSDPEFLAAYNVIGRKIYEQAKLSPKLTGATDYPPTS